MAGFDDLVQNIQRILLQLPHIKIKDIIEIIIIAFVIYQILKWVRGTRAWMLFKGIIILVIIAAVAMFFELNTILWIFANTINVGIIAILIVFQPELRRALEQLGRGVLINSLFNMDSGGVDKNQFTEKQLQDIVHAVEEMGRVKTGALIVIERQIPLIEYEKTGIPIGATVTKELLINIFEHNTPLHDGAVIIRRDTIVAATCYLPLSDNMTISKELGTRHRAGLGISEVADCMVIIVSEENGNVSVALGGNIVRDVDAEYLKNKLIYLFEKKEETKKLFFWKGRHKNDKETDA